MSQHQDLQIFGFKLKKYEVIFTHLKLWVAVATLLQVDKKCD